MHKYILDRMERIKAIREEQREEHMSRERSQIKKPRRVISKVRKPRPVK